MADCALAGVRLPRRRNGVPADLSNVPPAGLLLV